MDITKLTEGQHIILGHAPDHITTLVPLGAEGVVTHLTEFEIQAEFDGTTVAMVADQVDLGVLGDWVTDSDRQLKPKN